MAIRHLVPPSERLFFVRKSPKKNRKADGNPEIPAQGRSKKGKILSKSAILIDTEVSDMVPVQENWPRKDLPCEWGNWQVLWVLSVIMG